MMTGVVPIGRNANPFPQTGVSVDAAGAPHYDDLPSSLIAMLDAHAKRTPDAEALVELGGERLTYKQLWETWTRRSPRSPPSASPSW